MKVTLDQCKTPTCRGCGRRIGFDHYGHCSLAETQHKMSKRTGQ